MAPSAYPALAHTPLRFFVMTKKLLVMTKNIQTDGDMGSPCIGRPVLAGRELLSNGRCFGRSAAVCNTSHSFADQHAAPFALRAWWRKAASPPFGGRNTKLGINRHRCQEFRHDEIFRDRDSDLQRCSWSLPEPCSRSNRITTTITTDAGMVTRR